VMHYTNVRLSFPWMPLFLYNLLLCVVWYQFIPFQSNFRNGNTWIFVIPMFLGISVDLGQSVFRKQVCDNTTDLVSWRWLLGVHLSAMLMAFAFTLAFRGMIRIQIIYFGAAACVAGLFVVGSWLIFSQPLFLCDS